MTTTPDFRRLCEELAKLARCNHYTCEDSWYSCPKSPDGCANDSAGDDCTCGADSHNDKVDELLAIVLATSPPEPRKVMAWMYQGEDDFDGIRWRENWEVTIDEKLARFKSGSKEPIPLFKAHDLAPPPEPPTDERLLRPFKKALIRNSMQL